MSATTNCIRQAKQLEATQTTQYTSVNQKTIIDKLTVYNTDTVTQTVSIGIVPSAGTGGLTTDTVFKQLQPKETYTFPEIVGHTMEAGDFISTIGSVAAKLNLRISGRIVT